MNGAGTGKELEFNKRRRRRRRLRGGKPSAERYIDSVESYSTNEVAIYWNSVLLYVLARLSKLEA